MEQSPSWWAYSSEVSQEIPRILWKPEVHHHVYKNLVTFLRPMPDKSSPFSHLTSWRCVLALSSHLRTHLQSGRLFLKFSHQNSVCISSLPPTCHMYSSSHSLFDHPDSIWRGVQIMQLFAVKFLPLPCYLFSLRSKYLPHQPITLYTSMWETNFFFFSDRASRYNY